MTGVPEDKIILCQPGNGQGCSVCCGLFNFMDITRDSLHSFLNSGISREREFSAHDKFTYPWKLRSRFSHICPYQGFISLSRPGCLVHPLYSLTDGRDRSLFAHKICENFFCPAHSILTQDEKLFLLENINDWYLYSIAIADPETYSFIYNFVKEKYDGSCNRGSSVLLVSEGLAKHAAWLRIYEGEIFFYSIPEYNLNKINFSVRYRDDLMEQIVSSIAGKAHSIL